MLEILSTAFKNYDWSEKENETINGGGQTEDLLKKTCESHSGFIFSKGDDSKARGCGKGWCCQPSNQGNNKPSKSLIETEYMFLVSSVIVIN